MTDPTITIAGLRARINSLLSAVQHSNRTTAERVTMFVEASSNADRLTAERDALAAQLAEVRTKLDATPKVCAIHSYEHGPGPCMTCGAWPPGTRELIAACRTRIAGLESAADERSRTGQMSEPERSEWIGAAVAVADALGGSLGPVSGTSGTIDPREWIHFAAGLADRAKKLTARVAELEARPVLTEERLRGALFACADGASDAEVRAILAALGPVTLPAQDAADAIVAKMQRYGWWCSQDSGDGRCEADMRRALASLGASPTSPTVAPQPAEVFAGVSIDELCSVYSAAYGERPGHRDDRRPDAIRAVLARLEVSLVAPADPEAVAREYHASGALPDVPSWTEISSFGRHIATQAMRTALRASGIPVTPEVGK